MEKINWNKMLSLKISCMVLFFVTGIICIIGVDWRERKVQANAFQYKEALGQKRDEMYADDVLFGNTMDELSRTERTDQKGSDGIAVPEKNYDGYIDCLLEIPKIDLCRVVISGGDIKANLSQHYFVAARQSMTYGEGCYVIFGHQSFTKGKGMNRLDELVVGDLIYISGEDFEDTYEVTEVDASCKGEVVGDFTADSNHLALYTCKKQWQRPKPYMIVRAVKRP